MWKLIGGPSVEHAAMCDDQEVIVHAAGVGTDESE